MPQEVYIKEVTIHLDRPDVSFYLPRSQDPVGPDNVLKIAENLVEELGYTVNLNRNNAGEAQDYRENLQGLLKIARQEKGTLSPQDELFFNKLYNAGVEKSYDDSSLTRERATFMSWGAETIRYKDLLDNLDRLVTPRKNKVLEFKVEADVEMRPQNNSLDSVVCSAKASDPHQGVKRVLEPYHDQATQSHKWARGEGFFNNQRHFKKFQLAGKLKQGVETSCGKNFDNVVETTNGMKQQITHKMF